MMESTALPDKPDRTVLDHPRCPWAEGRLTAGFLMQAPSGTYLLFFHDSRNVFPETHGNASLAMVSTDDLSVFWKEEMW